MGISGLKKLLLAKLNTKKTDRSAALAANPPSEGAPETAPEAAPSTEAAPVVVELPEGPKVDIDLTKIAAEHFAKTGKDLRIACDGNALVFWIQKTVESPLFPHPSLEYGGQESVNYENLRRFFTLFREQHIVFTVTVDGVDLRAGQWTEAVARANKQAESSKKLWVEMFETGSFKSPNIRGFLSPFSLSALEDYVKNDATGSLKLVYSSRGSADILQALCMRADADPDAPENADKCFAVMSEESDFFVMDSRFVPLSNLVFKEDAKVESEEEVKAREAKQAELTKKIQADAEERKRQEEQRKIDNDEVGMEVVTNSKKKGRRVKQQQQKKAEKKAAAAAAAAALKMDDENAAEEDILKKKEIYDYGKDVHPGNRPGRA